MIDLHNHTSGKGVLVPTAGININADLGFAGFQATAIAAAVFNQLANTTTNLTNQAFTNVLGRPYWRDNSGVIKQVTLAGDALAAISSLSLTAIVAPGTPGAGTGTLYEDSTSLNLAFKNASGVVSHSVRSLTPVASNWVTGLSDAGVLSTSQPTWADIGGTLSLPSGTIAAGSLLFTAIAAPGTPAAGKGSLYEDSTSKNLALKNDAGVVNHGIQTKAAVSHQWLTAVNDDGSSVLAQPAFTDLTSFATIAQGGTGQTTAGAGFDALANSSWTIAAVNGTTDLSTVAGISGTVTGSGSFTTTGFGTMPAGTRRLCKVGAGLAWVLQNGTAIVIPGGNSIALAAGDQIELSSLGSGNWQVVAINNAAAGLVVGGSGTFISNGGVATCYFNTTAMQPQVILRAVSGSAAAPEYGFSSDPGSDSGFYFTGTDNQIGWSAGGIKQLLVDTNGLQHATRHQWNKGASIASATTITLGNDGNVFTITGTTPIATITSTNWQAGAEITLIFTTGAASMIAVSGNITTRGAAAVTTTANSAWKFTWDGTAWRLHG
jgi:hypothetical protein